MMAKVAVVTGSSRGLGLHVARKLVETGWLVVGCSRKKPDWNAGEYTHHTLDVTDEGAVVAMIRSVARTHGRIDALVNNAGMASMNHLLLTPMDTARRLIETNTLAALLFIREVGKAMVRAGGGRIVNLSSVAVALDLEGEAAYAASKAALESLTRVAARELGGKGITVNAIAPTPIQTDLIKGVPKEKISQLMDRQAIKRPGTADDVWNVVEFFLRPESSFITGQLICLGGIRN